MKSEYQTGLNKHLRDAGMVFAMPATISWALQMPVHENAPIEERRGLSGEELLTWDTAVDCK